MIVYCFINILNFSIDMAKEYFENAQKMRRARILEIAIRDYHMADHVLDFGCEGERFKYELEEVFVNPQTLKITILYKPSVKNEKLRCVPKAQVNI